MAKEINIIGAKPKRIHILNQPKRTLDPTEVAAALGAEPLSEAHGPNLDLISLAALGGELIKRLRSTGGRPALADATEICRVPLSAEDVKALEAMVAQLEASSGAKPSVGHLVSVIVRAHLQALKVPPDSAGTDGIGQESAPTLSKTLLQQVIDEQIRPLRDHVCRLENELRIVSGRGG